MGKPKESNSYIELESEYASQNMSNHFSTEKPYLLKKGDDAFPIQYFAPQPNLLCMVSLAKSHKRKRKRAWQQSPLRATPSLTTPSPSPSPSCSA